MGAREGDITFGDYRVLLPDGRTQVVEYKVEGENTGYIVSVKYQGDPKDVPSSVRKRRRIRQKLWKPYAREEPGPASKGPEMLKSEAKSFQQATSKPSKTKSTQKPAVFQ